MKLVALNFIITAVFIWFFEASSGNMGIGLALVGGQMGYQVTICMPDTLLCGIQVFGIQMVTVPRNASTKLALRPSTNSCFGFWIATDECQRVNPAKKIQQQ